MNVGMIGLGKLGLPVAVAMAYKGHSVMGYDIDPKRMSKDNFTEREEWPATLGEFETFNEALQASTLTFGTLAQAVEHSDIIFLSVQTPHDPRFEGNTRVPSERKDFDYSHLRTAVQALSNAITAQAQDKVVVIISTVLPGTIRREILPLCSSYVRLCYNPYFIAMGTVVSDFYWPEFVLFGEHDPAAAAQARQFYSTITTAPVFATTIENAEAIKVFYNTYITMKIVFANTIMEMCHHLPGTNVDVVVRGLTKANRRLLSPAYMQGGMGDGGGCHPRDNIALSWLAQELGISYDLFGSLMEAREMQTQWIAELALTEQIKSGRKIVILGKAFKADTNLTTGSPAVLLYNLLRENTNRVQIWDPYVDGGEPPIGEDAIYVIGTRHLVFLSYKFPENATIIDPWRMIKAEDVVSLGRPR